jgi:hypothetical protein
MNSLIFDIVSLIDYNNDIIKELNLSNKYIFDITKLEYLKQIRHQSINSLDKLTSNNNSSDENIAILEFEDNLSTSNLSSSNLSSTDSYNTLIENWSYNSLISLESEFSLSNSNNNSNNSILKNNYLNNTSIDLDKISINEFSFNNEINNILKNDYLNFLNYYKELNDIKYKNLKLYKDLTQKLIYINLEKIKNSFIRLL